jgi:uncharacterized membrane protein
MICICEPRDTSARSFNRLLSTHTIMIFVVLASTDHLLWAMAIKTPDTHNHLKRRNGTNWGLLARAPSHSLHQAGYLCALLSLTIAGVAGLPSINVHISYCSGS